MEKGVIRPSRDTPETWAGWDSDLLQIPSIMSPFGDIEEDFKTTMYSVTG